MSFHLSLSLTLLESNSVSPCGNALCHCNAIQWQTSSLQILFYIVHPPLLWASNRSFSCWHPIMNYGWPPLFVHSGDMSIPFHSPFPNRILCYILLYPDPHLRIAYAICIFNAQYPTQPTTTYPMVYMYMIYIQMGRRVSVSNKEIYEPLKPNACH